MKTRTIAIIAILCLCLSLLVSCTTYTVTFETNGGNEIEQKKLNKSFAMPENPEKDGYTFTGWFSNENLTTPFKFTSVEEIESSITLYAGWASEQCTVTLNYQGATSDNEVATAVVKYGESYILPLPARVGYIFKGWYLAASGGTALTDNEGNSTATWAQIESAVTLYAQWTSSDAQVLDTPDASSVIYGEGVLYWQPIESAVGYAVTFDGKTYNTTDSCLAFPLIAQGKHEQITITALYSDSKFNSLPATVNIYRPYDRELNIREINIDTTAFGILATNEMTAMAEGTPADAVSFNKVYVIVTGKSLTFSNYSESEGITILHQQGSEATVTGNTITTGSKNGVVIISGKLNATGATEVRILRITPDTVIFSQDVSYTLRNDTIENINDSNRINYLDKEIKSYTVGTKNAFIPDIKMSSSDFALQYAIRISELVEGEWTAFSAARLEDYAYETYGNIQFLPNAEGKRFEVTVGSRYKRTLTPKRFIVEVNNGHNVYTQEQMQECFSDLNVNVINILRNITLSIPKNADYHFYSYLHDTDGVYEYGTPETSPELYYSKAGCVMGLILTHFAEPNDTVIDWDEHGYAGTITQTDFSTLYGTEYYNAAQWLDQLTFYSIDPTDTAKTPKAVSAYGTAAKDIKIAELRTLFFNTCRGSDESNLRDGKWETGDLNNWRAGSLTVDYTFANGSTEPIKASGVLFDKDGNDITDLVANIDGDHLLENEDFMAYESGYADNPDRPVISRNAPYCYNEVFVRTNFWVTPYNPLYNSKVTVYGNYLMVDGSKLPLQHVYAAVKGNSVTEYTSDAQEYASESAHDPMHCMYEAIFGCYGRLDSDIDYADDFQSYTWKNEGLQIEVNDLTTMANDARASGMDKEGNEVGIEYYADKGYSNYRVDKARLTLNNCIVQNSVINVVVQEGYVNVNKSLLYNTFDWNFYVMLRSYVRCEDSYIGFSGGAALGMQNYLGLGANDEIMKAGGKYYATLIELHDTYLSNWVTGTETWFTLYSLNEAALLAKTTLDGYVREFTGGTRDSETSLVSGGERCVTVKNEEGIEFFNFAMLGFTASSSAHYDMYNVIIETTDDKGVVHTYDMVRPGHSYFLEQADPRKASLGGQDVFMAPVGSFSQTEEFVKYTGSDIQTTITAAATDYGTNGTLTANYTPEQLVIINSFLADANLGSGGKYTLDETGITAFVQDYAIQRHNFSSKDVKGILTTYLTTGTATDADVVTAYQKACLGKAELIANPVILQAFIDDSAVGCVLGDIALALGTAQVAPGALTPRQQEIVAAYTKLGGNLVGTVTYFSMKDSFADSTKYYEKGDTDGTTLVEVRGGISSFRFSMFVWHFDTANLPDIELIAFNND